MVKVKLPTTPNFTNLAGETFNSLTVLGYAGKDKSYNSKWLCKCDCGNSCVVLGSNLKNSNTKSCGCLSIGRLVKDIATHKGEFKEGHLKECFDYNTGSGLCFWKERPINHFASESAHLAWNTRFYGKAIGTKMSRGYLFIGLGGNHLLHRMIFAWMGESITGKQVDHINGVRTDNRWVNLRLVDQIDNLKNKSLRASNKTGVSGVSFYKNLKSKPFRVTYYENGNKRATEFFVTTLFEAACARKSFENKNGYHKNHGRKNKKGID